LCTSDAKAPLWEQTIAEVLDQALRGRRPIRPSLETNPELSVADAYRVSLAFLHRRLKRGDIVIGKKIGVTSQVVQEMLGVYEPDYGFLLESMLIADGGTVTANRLIQPRADAEIAFRLSQDLAGPGASEADVLNATAYVAPCIEIVDSRIADWCIRNEDTVADNASCGEFTVRNAIGAVLNGIREGNRMAERNMFVDSLAAANAASAFNLMAGFALEEAEPGSARLSVQARPEPLNPAGALHAAVQRCLIDTA
jgi:2-keto-4-pentenoate hydratase